LRVLYDGKSVSDLIKRIEDMKSKKSKATFAEIKSEFLKSAA